MSTLITVLVFFGLYMIDQVTKYIALKVIGTQGVTIIPGFCDFRLVYNPGMAFGLGSEYTWILMAVSLVATIALIYFATKMNDWKHNKVGAISLTMALAGCAGNLYDRFMTTFDMYFKSPKNKGVIDMVHLDWFDAVINFFTQGKSGEITMNFADIFLVIGVIVFAIDYAFFYEKKRKKAKMNKGMDL